MSEDEPNLSVREFVHEVAQAWGRLHLYPRGHPERGRLLDHATQLGRRLAQRTGVLELGVAADALLTRDERLETASAERLAHSLYRSNVALVRFRDDLSAADLERFLSALELGRVSAHAETPITDLFALGRGPIELETADYSGLLATSEADEPVRSDELSLWERFLRILLGAGDPDREGITVDEVLRSIQDLLPESRTALVEGDVARELVHLAEQLAGAIDEHLEEARLPAAALEEMAELLASLPELFRLMVLVALLADDDPITLETLASALPLHDVVAALRLLRDREGTVSPELLPAIGSLLWNDSPGDEAPSPAAPAAPAAPVADVDHIAPARTDRFLAPLPRHRPPLARTEHSDATPDTTRQALIGTLLALLAEPALTAELRAGALDRVGPLVLDLVANGRVQVAVALLKQLRGDWAADEPEVCEARGRLERDLCGEALAHAITETLRSGASDQVSWCRELVALLGPRLLRSLLILQSERPERKDRRLLFDFLRQLDGPVTGEARALLGTGPWYLDRNLLALLATRGDRSVLPDVHRCLAHDDARVRLEAARALIRLESELPEPIVRRFLADADPHNVERLVAILGAERVRTAVGPLAELLHGADPLGRRRGIRLAALNALGAIGDPSALEPLRGFFAPVLRHSREECRAAFASLAGYPAEHALPLAQRGLRARDRVIRESCRALLAAAGELPS